MRSVIVTILIFMLTSCVNYNSPKPDAFDAQDPLRPLNEQTFAFNKQFDKYLLRPVAKAYHYTPSPIRDRLGNFINNLGEPLNFVNGVLQLKPKVAFISFWRFMINSTVGIGGLNDFASLSNLPAQDQDFGKTLGSYGICEGPYIVLPILGPSTARDTTGQVVDEFIDPLGKYLNSTQSAVETATDNITTREDKFDAIDHVYYKVDNPYTATRAAYLQQSNKDHVSE